MGKSQGPRLPTKRLTIEELENLSDQAQRREKDLVIEGDSKEGGPVVKVREGQGEKKG